MRWRIAGPISVMLFGLGIGSQALADDPRKSPTTCSSEPTCAADESGPADIGDPLLERSGLAGEWLCFRERLRDKGTTFDLSSTVYYQGITSGGLQETFRFGGRNDYLLNVDGAKAGLWPGLVIRLHGETVYADSVNFLTGAFMPVNIGRSLPVQDGSVTALTGVRAMQVLSENFAVFAGKLNTLDDVQQPFMPSRGLDAGFMNTTFVVNPVLARTVQYSTWGAGLALLVDGQPAGGITILDTHNTPTTTGFDTFFSNGMTLMVQGGHPTTFLGRPGVQAFGGTYSSGRYAETDAEAFTMLANIVQGLPPVARIRGSWSLFYAGQQTLWVDPGNAKRSWGLFGGAALSDGNPNPVRWSASAGLAGSSPVTGRDLDTFGVGYFYMGLSDSFKSITPAFLPLRDERGVELFYNVAVTPCCHITPDLQVITPARGGVETSLLFGIRANVDF